MRDILILFAFALSIGLGGFVVGRISTAPEPDAILPKLDLSDAAIAHIVHESIRAYQRSMGVIKMKTWNNLEQKTRDALTSRVQRLRNGQIVILDNMSPIARIEAAIIDIAS